MKLINRDSYIKRAMSVNGAPDIKVITGVRRSGKSKLLEKIIAKIKRSDRLANVVHINFNILKFEPLLEYHALYDYVERLYVKRRHNYLFIDEAQMCKNFEKAINSLHAEEKFDIYLTGSNAFLLSSDLATLFTGRTFEIEVFPFSFAEYLKYYEIKNKYAAFDSYLEEGGMAGSYLYKNLSDKYDYINGEVFNALIIRDIINKYKIRNKALLNSLVDFLMDNIGNIVSVRKIAASLTSGKTKANDKTIGKYIEYLCKAFAFYKVRRYDIRGKKYLASEDKYYLSDHAFKYARLGTKNMDYGHVLENVVAIELLRRGYELYVGVLYKKEIDFVAVKKDEKIYMQVSDDITNPQTLERELAPLLAIKDAYPKLLLARTRQKMRQVEGVQIYDAADWLSAK